MTQKKVYAVASGRMPGIYDSWPEAEKQVKGFAGARFKGFTNRSEAENWLCDPQYKQTTPQKNKKLSCKALTPMNGISAFRSSISCEKNKKLSCKALITAPSSVPGGGGISIYTDGGCSHNPGPGGYGAILVVNGQEKEISGGFRLTTNNRMELMACIVALRTVQPRNLPITVFSDSSYVVNGINKGWAKGWRKKGWIKSDKQPAVNPDLWGELLELVEETDVTFQWVKGHAGHPLNERCDRLAVAALKEKDLPSDQGYSGK
jgi:ribonuclease HI